MIVEIARAVSRGQAARLGQLVPSTADPIMREALALIADDVASERVRGRMEAAISRAMRCSRRQYQMARDGLLAIQRGETPGAVLDLVQADWPAVRRIARRIHSLRSGPGTDREIEDALVARTKALCQRSLAELGCAGVAEVLALAADVVRQGGVLALVPAMGEAADPFLGRGASLVVAGMEPELLSEHLGFWSESLLHQQERRYGKVLTGACAIQAGREPGIVARMVAAVF
ncbi:MAG: hypothetical protein AB1505_29840 [Candidatus Latescibacterota bacterium]